MPPRIQIRPPRKDAVVDINETWKRILEPAVRQIFHLESDGNSEKLSFKVLYDSVYRLVTQGHGRTLHRKFQQIMQECCEEFATTPAIANLSQPVESEEFLDQISEVWKSYTVSLEKISDIFLYLDRSFCSVTKSLTTDQIGKQAFKEKIGDILLDDIVSQLIVQINRDREGQMVNSQTLQFVVGFLKELSEGEGEIGSNLYEYQFRSALKKSSLALYKTKLDEISSSPSATQIRRIESWLTSEENSLGKLYLPKETTQELVECLESEAFIPKLAGILQDSSNSVVLWIHNSDLETLKLASVLEQRGEKEELRKLVEQVKVELNENQLTLNKEQRDAMSWIESTNQLREKYIKIADAIGQNSWSSVLSKTFTKAVGDSEQANGLLATYLDELLKKNSTIPTENVEPSLDKALIIYNCLSDKDEFSLIFQRTFARRLLNNSSRSREYEYSWLQRLKEENLNSDYYKFENMISNLDESRKLFHGSTSIAPGTIPTSVNILSMHLWPKSMLPNTAFTPNLPPLIRDAKHNVEEFYNSVKKDRVLKWNYGLSVTDVKIRVADKTYLASVPLACMSILCLFEGDESYSTQEISEKTNIPTGGELERHLKSIYLAAGSNLLLKSPPGKDVSLTDTFTFNTGFKSPKTRFKVKMVSLSKSSANSGSSLGATTKEEADVLAQERAQKTEAAIVRIMKAKKELTHNALAQLTANMLHQYFTATPRIIKGSIQNLLSKGYLERKEDDPQTYRYVA